MATNKEYRFKELIQNIIETVGILSDKGADRIRPTFHTKETVQFKPIFVLAFETPKHNDKYILFTSRYYTDTAGKRTSVYSSIRLVAFHGGSPVVEKIELDDLKRMTMEELEERPYLPKGSPASSSSSSKVSGAIPPSWVKAAASGTVIVDGPPSVVAEEADTDYEEEDEE